MLENKPNFYIPAHSLHAANLVTLLVTSENDIYKYIFVKYLYYEGYF